MGIKNMNRALRIGTVCAVAFCLCSVTYSQQKSVPEGDPEITAASSGDLAVIPPLPRGKSTILGGSIRDIDPVLDRFTLDIIGEKPMRILFDQRTQLFLDGKKISLRELHPAEHASIQTTLDGTSVFAISIHILSQLQQGDYPGKVLSYNPGSGELELVSGAGGEPVRVRVTGDTRFARTGQNTFTSASAGPADLQSGSLVSVRFAPDGKGRGEATEITFLATPGSEFVFSGDVIALDPATGSLVLLDPRNHERYQIAFVPGSISALQNLHRGQRVRISAQYDGTRYVARDVAFY